MNHMSAWPSASIRIASPMDVKMILPPHEFTSFAVMPYASRTASGLPGGELMALEHRDSNRGLLLVQLFEGADFGRIEDQGLGRPRLAKRGQHAEVVLLAGRTGSLVGPCLASAFSSTATSAALEA